MEEAVQGVPSRRRIHGEGVPHCQGTISDQPHSK
jgi:hypothetical protein